MKRNLLIFIALLLFAFGVSADTHTADVARIHVIANSDSDEDIYVKMKVAEEIKAILSDEKFDSMEDIKNGLEARIEKIVEAADRVLLENGADYSAAAEVGTKHFDKKSLGNSAFPEGDYTALTVTLGDGKGHNWWSVVFPDISLEASLSMGEEGSCGKTVIIGGDTVVKIRCLIFDLFNLLLTKK